MNPFGTTRTCVTPQHALIAPDGHVQTALPGWTASEGIILISPQLGARFTQYFALMEEGGKSGPPLAGVERFAFVVSGSAAFEAGDERGECGPGGYVYIPPDTRHALTAQVETRLVVFERRYLAFEGIPAAPVVWGHEPEVRGEPFLGDQDLIVKRLLPESASFDFAVNTMTFAPGAALPFVETHVMEHGLLMLRGGGIYRLHDSWYPVAQGDVIWMGPYCPQWFGALGKEPAAYLLYKDTGRDPFALGG